MHAYERSWPMIGGLPVWDPAQEAGSSGKPAELRSPLTSNYSALSLLKASPNLRTELLRDEVLPSLRGVVADSRKASPLDDRELPGVGSLASGVLGDDGPEAYARKHGTSIAELLGSPTRDTYVAPRATVHITNGLAGVKKGGQYKMDGFGEEVRAR